MTPVSIAIVTWNSQETLQNCVSSLFDYVPAEDFELFIVDNGSQDKAYLDSYHDISNVKVIQNSENLGYAKAANIGWQNASGKFFLVLNPDIIFLSNPFPRLIRELEEKPQIGVIAPLLCDIKGRAQITGYYPTFPSIPQYILTRTVFSENIAFLPKLAEQFFHAYIGGEGVHYVDQIPGAFLLFRKNLFGSSPPLNEAYFIWMEDVDFCHRIHEKGLKVATLTDEKITHLGGASFAKRETSWKRLVSTQSYLTYTRLYFKPLPRLILTILMTLDSIARILLFSIFRCARGPRKIAVQARVEIKILKSILGRTSALKS